MNIVFREVLESDKEFILLGNKEINDISNLNDSILSSNIDIDLFENKICKTIVCEIDGEKAGFVMYSYIYWANCGQGIYLSQAYVKKNFRKMGILKKLLHQIEINEKECKFITNLVGEENVVMKDALKCLNFSSSNLITYYRKIENNN